MSNLFHQASIDSVGSKYDLVVLAARRARDLKKGHNTAAQAVSAALADIDNGTIDKDYAVDALAEDMKNYRENQENDIV